MIKKIFFLLAILFFASTAFSQAAAMLSRTAIASGCSPYDCDLQAVFDRAEDESFTLPSETVRGYMNDLVLALKSAGYWDGLDYFAIYQHDGSEGFSRINWKDPDGSLATNVNSMSWSSTGYTPCSSSCYLDLNWNPSTNAVNYTQNMASVGVLLSDIDMASGENFRPYGILNGAVATLYFASKSGATTTNYIAINSSSVSATGSEAGETYVNSYRASSSSLYYYFGTTLKGFSTSNSSSAPLNTDMLVGATWNMATSSVLYGSYTGYEIRGIWIGGLDRGNNSDLIDILNTNYFDNV